MTTTSPPRPLTGAMAAGRWGSTGGTSAPWAQTGAPRVCWAPCWTLAEVAGGVGEEGMARVGVAEAAAVVVVVVVVEWGQGVGGGREALSSRRAPQPACSSPAREGLKRTLGRPWRPVGEGLQRRSCFSRPPSPRTCSASSARACSRRPPCCPAVRTQHAMLA